MIKRFLELSECLKESLIELNMESLVISGESILIFKKLVKVLLCVEAAVKVLLV